MVLVMNNWSTSYNDKLHALVVDTWEFCMLNKIKLTAANLPGSTNIVADRGSKKIYREGE